MAAWPLLPVLVTAEPSEYRASDGAEAGKYRVADDGAAACAEEGVDAVALFALGVPPLHASAPAAAAAARSGSRR